jgi:NADH-quinone oxidoreductase subunit C/D
MSTNANLKNEDLSFDTDSANSDDSSNGLGAKEMILNLGPSHPAFHGALRTQVHLDGERIVKAASEMGYLHRCFEKHSENSHYNQVVPYTDRLNYCSGLMNNVGYCKAVEELMGIEMPERGIAIRVLVCELSRVIDHLVCVGTNIVDIGALTNFWYAFNVREKAYDLIEKLTGARLTYSYTRVGGLTRDLYDGFESDLETILKEIETNVKDITSLIGKNKIFHDRTRDVGVVTKEQALDWGFTGPCLRASGVEHDLRKASPYYGYEDYDFDIPVGETGDTFDRIMVRLIEIHQSIKIIRQCMKRMPSGPIRTDDRRVSMPEKEEVYSSIEGLMNHFKLVMHGIKPPVGSVYSFTEAANGELGFYLISDGDEHPYRLKVRPPCFPMFAAYEEIIKDHMIADAIAILGSLNVVVGELDR